MTEPEMYAPSLACMMGNHHLCPGCDSLSTPCPCRCHREAGQLGAETVTKVVDILEKVGSIVVQAEDVRYALGYIDTELGQLFHPSVERLALASGYTLGTR